MNQSRYHDKKVYTLFITTGQITKKIAQEISEDLSNPSSANYIDVEWVNHEVIDFEALKRPSEHKIKQLITNVSDLYCLILVEDEASHAHVIANQHYLDCITNDFSINVAIVPADLQMVEELNHKDSKLKKQVNAGRYFSTFAVPLKEGSVLYEQAGFKQYQLAVSQFVSVFFGLLRDDAMGFDFLDYKQIFGKSRLINLLPINNFQSANVDKTDIKEGIKVAFNENKIEIEDLTSVLVSINMNKKESTLVAIDNIADSVGAVIPCDDVDYFLQYHGNNNIKNGEGVLILLVTRQI